MDLYICFSIGRTEEFLMSILHRSTCIYRADRIILLLLFVLLIFFGGQLSGQQVPETENLFVTAFTNEDGLRQSMVSQVCQDEKGLIWMVTGDGLHYFDGQQFRFFRVPYLGSCNQTDNVMRALIENEPGSLLVASSSSLLHFNTSIGIFKVIYRKEGIYPVLFDQLIGNHVLAWIKGMDFFLLIGNKISPIKLEFTNQLPGTFIPQKAIKSGKDEILISSSEGILSIVPVIKQNKMMFRATWIPLAGCSGIAKSGDGKVVVFAKSKLYSITKSKKLEFITEVKISGKPSLFIDSRDNKWFIDQSYNKLYKLSSEGLREICLYSINGTKAEIIRPSITSIFEDTEHNLWFGTDGNGVLAYNPAKVQFQRSDIGFTRCISGINNKVWAGTFNNGLWELSRNLSSARRINPLYFGNKIYFLDMISDKLGRMWILTREGIEVTNGDGKILWEYPFQCLLGKFILSAGDSLFVVADNNLFKFRQDELPRIYSSTKFFAARVLLEVGDYYWVGTADGLFRYNKSFGLTANNLPDISAFKLSAIPVYGMLFHNGLIWATTGNGIQCYSPDGQKHKMPSCLESLANDVIYALIPDKNNRFWITGNNGIGCVSPDENRMIWFGSKNNLQAPEFNFNAFYRVDDHHFYFGGIQGINHIDPLLFKPVTKTREVKLISLFVSDTAYSACIPQVNPDFTLSRSAPHISGRVFTPDYLSDGAIQYSFLLEGYEQKWSLPSGKPDFSYRNLSPGKYRLLAKSAKAYHIWSKPVVLLTFSISKPYYKRWWFLALTIICIIAITTLIVRLVQQMRYRAKIKEMERQYAIEKERSRISKDMHDEVGASLTRISILSELAKKQNSDPAKAQQIIEQISDISGSVVDEMSEIIWAMNPRNDTLDSFASYIRQYISGYLQTVNIPSTFAFPDEVPSHFMSSELRRNLFLTIKEALHNVVKHAEASKVHTELYFSGQFLKIVVSDDGKGFDEQKIKSWRNGLFNMRKRIEESGGEFQLTSGLNSGTKIKIEISLGIHSNSH